MMHNLIFTVFLSAIVLLLTGCAKDSNFFATNAQPVPQLKTDWRFTRYNVVYKPKQDALSTSQKNRIATVLRPHNRKEMLILSPCRDYQRANIAINKKRFKNLYYYLYKLGYKVTPQRPAINACTNVNIIQISTKSQSVKLPTCYTEDGYYIPGCSLERNLGSMLADPNDLTPSERPHEFDAIPMSRAVETYR